MWDQRYAEPAYAYGVEPNDFLRQVADQLRGPVLELACGEGRNAVFLAHKGLEVHGVDSSHVGLAKLRKLATARGVSVQTTCADLADYPLGEARWGAIVAIFAHLPPALRRAVHRSVVRALRPGGLFVLEAYRPEQLTMPGTGGPPTHPMLYTEADLRSDLDGLTATFELVQREVNEGRYHRGRSAVIQVLARRPAS